MSRRRDRRNKLGSVYALTVITPVVPGREEALAADLARFGRGPASPFAALPRTHFARWVVIHHLPYEGPLERRDQLDRRQLLFTSTFDGDLDSYLDDICARMAPAAHEVWRHCEAYPGPADADPEGFKRYMRDHQVRSLAFFGADTSPVEEVQRALRWRGALRELGELARQPQLDPAALGAEVRRRFT